MAWAGSVTDDQPWLAGLVAVAEEEARERGEATVAGHHVALALTRDPDAQELLEAIGLSARRWRDYLNFILGVRASSQAEREQRHRPGHHRSPAEVYHHGPVEPDEGARGLLDTAHAEAAQAGHPIGAAHLLVAITSRSSGVATGTARWLGVTEDAVRHAAALPSPPPRQPAAPDPNTLPQPQRHGPLVLFGGGELAEPALTIMTELAAGHETGRAVQLAVVGAATPDGTAQRQAQLQALLTGVEVLDAGLTDRSAAHDPQVADELRRADVIFLDGGDPERLAHALADTPALEALVAASDHDTVIAGYSAGSQALGAGARLGGWADAHPVALLGWLTDVVIVPHCSGPGMINELRATMAAFPGTRGLGIAHAGAVLLPTGWHHAENLATGYDHGSILLDHPDAEPHLLSRQPHPLS